MLGELMLKQNGLEEARKPRARIHKKELDLLNNYEPGKYLKQYCEHKATEV
jgi:hypothetical protein